MIDLPGAAAAIESIRSPLLTEFFTSVTYLGSSITVLALVIGLYFLEDRSYFKNLSTGLAATYITVYAAKFIFAVERPANISRLLEPFTMYSFPSGHAAIAVTTAVILSAKKKALKPYLYLMASLVCFSRYYLGLHYIIDIVAGVLIGGTIGKLVASNEAALDKFIEKYLN